jgi:hypothetical protein
MDYGYHQDPSEIGIAYQSETNDKLWQVFARIHIVGVDSLAQARLINFIVESLGRDLVKRIVIDLASGSVAIALELTQLQRWASITKRRCKTLAQRRR